MKLERVRLFEPGELERLCTEAGATVRHRLGDYDGAPFAPDSPRVILVAEGAAGCLARPEVLVHYAA